jgi:hypothetical protein
VSGYSNPSPPMASTATIGTDKINLFICMIVGMLIAWPFALCFGLIIHPRLFGFPKDVMKVSPTEAQRRWGAGRRRQVAKARCWTMCCGLSVLLWGVVGVILWGVLHLGDTKLVSTFADQSRLLGGNYVQLNRDRTGPSVLYSPSGKVLGNVGFTESTLSWTMQINDSSVNLTQIIYSGITNTLNPDEIHLTASCRSNVGTNSTGLCFTGTLLPYDISLTPRKSHPGEYQGSLNVTLEAGQNVTFNNSVFANLSTSTFLYQGIGHAYPPVGQWYVGNTLILGVLWNITGNRACDGLRINLAKNSEVLSWSVLGIVWKWWKLWADNGGCT